MGPEAAILSQRLAGSSSRREFRNLETPRENPLYVEAAVQAQLREFLGVGEPSRSQGVWTRLRAALRLDAGRDARRSEVAPRGGGARPSARAPAVAQESVRSISAVPIVRLDTIEPGRVMDGGASPLAALPIYHGYQR